MSSSLDLTGRVAVVVGGTSGLGRALAIGLARAGADVVATGRREALVSEACAEIVGLGRRSIAVTADVRSRESIDELRQRVVAEFGRVHTLVYAAGAVSRKPTAEVTEEEWASAMDTNATGALRACQSFYPALSAS